MSFIITFGTLSFAITGDVFLVEGDVGAMLSALARHECHLELRRPQRQHVVGDVLSGRSINADLQRAFASAANVNYSVYTDQCVR